MFPHKIEPIEESLNKKLMEDFKGERYGFVQVGTKKWLLPAIYSNHAEKLYNYQLRPDDVWVVTFPRSGTTLCQELVWLLNNNLDFKTSTQIPLEKRFPFLEYSLLHTERFHKEISEMNDNDPVVNEQLALWRRPLYEWDLPSPRHIKTHLPFSLLPPDITNKCKVIYVARNPKDVAVSYYHHNRLLRIHDYQGNFEKYWEYFSNDLVVFSPYWEHVKEAWDIRNRENLLFLFYENFITNMADSILQVARFLEKPINESDIHKLSKYLEIENFKKSVPLKANIAVKGVKNIGEQDFLRKGQIGTNKEFTPELSKLADVWIKENLASTDLKFPVIV